MLLWLPESLEQPADMHAVHVGFNPQFRTLASRTYYLQIPSAGQPALQLQMMVNMSKAASAAAQPLCSAQHGQCPETSACRWGAHPFTPDPYEGQLQLYSTQIFVNSLGMRIV